MHFVIKQLEAGPIKRRSKCYHCVITSGGNIFTCVVEDIFWKAQNMMHQYKVSSKIEWWRDARCPLALTRGCCMQARTEGAPRDIKLAQPAANFSSFGPIWSQNPNTRTPLVMHCMPQPSDCSRAHRRNPYPRVCT